MATDRYTVMTSRFAVGTGWSAPEQLEQDSAVSSSDVALSLRRRS